jgi:hypothetical protein
MGCDYYIVKQLHVEYVDDDDLERNANIELDREGAYFYNDMDSVDSDDTDDESFSSKFTRKYSKYLEVTYQPRILFQNNKWKSDSIQEKYSKNVTQEIGNGMLLKITKQEVRYLR